MVELVEVIVDILMGIVEPLGASAAFLAVPVAAAVLASIVVGLGWVDPVVALFAWVTVSVVVGLPVGVVLTARFRA